ncbi:MAG TPA: GGDEF domain-containing protein [Burkholderiales bacterium]
MELDTRTLVVACVLVSGLMGTVSFLFSAMHGTSSMIGRWGFAMVLLAVGLAGFALRGQIPDLLSITVANTLIIAALVLGIRCLRQFMGDTPRDALGIGMTVLALVLLLFFSEVRPNLQARILVVTVAMAVILVRGAWQVQKRTPRECQLSYRFTAAVLWMAGIVALLRAAGTIIAPPADSFASNGLEAGVFLFNTCFIVMATLGVMWIEFETLQARLVRSALTDPLTGLSNRAGFEREFERELSRIARKGTPFSVVMFDLDHFKQINDRFGHAAGDKALRFFADLLARTVRTHDVAARYGGEEFVLLMPGTERAEALHVAGRVRERLAARPVDVGRDQVPLTVSGGVATYGEQGKDFDALLKAADDALYAAKSAGRNRMVAAGAAAVV